MKRRERTRHLIELGGLVVKAGLVDLTDDDRATLYGAFLVTADRLRGEERANALTLWQRKGKRAFAADALLDAARPVIGQRHGRTDERDHPARAGTRAPMDKA
ncbi:conjugal transfer protein TraD [Sphingobium naphthae]|nr:conjugal transfer protein TraD [Sphingobium naphthae]